MKAAQGSAVLEYFLLQDRIDSVEVLSQTRVSEVIFSKGDHGRMIKIAEIEILAVRPVIGFLRQEIDHAQERQAQKQRERDQGYSQYRPVKKFERSASIGVGGHDWS